MDNMDKIKLKNYLNTRRQFWNYEDRYSIQNMGNHLFVAKIIEDLISCGFKTIHYEIKKEYYAFQIYQMLGLTIESANSDIIRFVWHKRTQ